MISTWNDRQTRNNMKATFSAMFPAQAALSGGGKGTASNPRNAAGRREAPATRSRLANAICHGLLVVALASTMGALLAAYNLRDTVGTQVAQWVKIVKG